MYKCIWQQITIFLKQTMFTLLVPDYQHIRIIRNSLTERIQISEQYSVLLAVSHRPSKSCMFWTERCPLTDQH